MAIINKLSELARSLLFVTLLNQHLFAHAHDCQNTTVMGYSGIHCGNATTTIPQDLSPDIEILGIVEAKFQNLTEDDLKRYSKLKVLHMAYMVIEKELDSNLFRPLQMINILEFVNNFAHHYNKLNFEIPESVEMLLLSYNQYITEPDLRNHSKIKMLHLDFCGLTRFPDLNISAPLEELYLQNNPLKNFTAEDLAPFCRLKKLGLQWSDLSLVQTKAQYCECAKLERWITDHNIKIPLKSSLNCTTDPENGLTSPDSCDLNISEESVDLYEECMKRSRTSPKYKKKWLLVIVPAGILIIVALIYGALRLSARDTTAK